ncbi:unnamed protein product [Rhizoctonia solani]|uniref:Chitin-binding type-2 domain-containing protein n=1 Tax=Rhizoctonia solani TaxID=456999 RepID=A0A8H3DBU7_9AGAM|nr:unnamed protein product [Rhizoctonia solani]
MLGLKISAILAACAYIVVAVPPVTDSSAPTSTALPPGPHQCLENEWFWPAKSVCLLIQGADHIPIPEGSVCPFAWYWHVDYNHCAPPGSSALSNRCPNWYRFDKTRFICVRRPDAPTSTPLPPGPHQCLDTEWFWQARGVCLRKVGPTGLERIPIPQGSVCPPEWYWHAIYNHCAPFGISAVRKSCPKGYRMNKRRFVCVRRSNV